MTPIGSSLANNYDDMMYRGRLISDTFDQSPSSSPSPPPHSSYTSSIHQSRSQNSSHSSNYWTRQLMKAEESDPFRWGHSGYKEQHPKEFISSNDSGDDVKVGKKKKKKKIKDEVKTKHREKLRKMEGISDKRLSVRKGRSKLKKRKRKVLSPPSSSTDSESRSESCYDDGENTVRRKRVKYKKFRKRGDSTTDSDSSHETMKRRSKGLKHKLKVVSQNS